jgi:vacuolar-type H+-ATPase subunit H
MTQSTTAAVDLSPLDQIRQAEVTVARRVAAARQAAHDAIREANEQAADLSRRAHERGCQEGLEEYDAIVSAAEREAQRLIEQAHIQARNLRRGDLFKEAAVLYAVAMVTGQELGDR